MCELYYLDHYRPDVRNEAEAANEKLDTAYELMQETKIAIEAKAADQLSERLAKVTLDTAFVKLGFISSMAARERLIRYAGELYRKAQYDICVELDYIEPLKVFLEDQIGEDD